MSASDPSLARPASLDEAARALGNGARPLAGGTDLVQLVRDRLVPTDTLVDIRGLLPRGIEGGRIGAGTTLSELESSETVPAALREACRLAASPQLRNMGTIGGNLLQATRCWYWRLAFPCYLHGGDHCHAREGEHREHAIFANEPCASAHPSDPAAALLALGAEVETTARRFPLGEFYRLPTDGDRNLTTLAPGELILTLHVPETRWERLPEGDGPTQVLVCARRCRGRPLARRDAARARRRRADPLGARLARRSGRGDASAGKRVQARDRAGPGPARARPASVIAAVVLAAGAASRFGAPKQRLLLPGILERVRASAVEEIVVVAGAHSLEAEGARIVECPEWESGPGASLRCGLAALPASAEAAVVCLADGPTLEPRAIDRVIDAWRSGAGMLLAASYGGERGHPVLLAREVWGEVPDEGARALEPVLLPCDDLGSPGDVDRADDLFGRSQHPAAES